MKVEIEIPIFRCQTDEEIFFDRLHSIPGLIQLTRRGSCLYVEVAGDDERKLLDALEDICGAWGAEVRVIG